MRRLVMTFVLVLAGFAAETHANPLDELYDDQEIASLQPAYERGLVANFAELSRVFNARQQALLGGLRISMIPRFAGGEPWGFHAGGNTLVFSTASVKFVSDMMLAITWLTENGYSLDTVSDYLVMLRYWNGAKGRPPKPRDALCIPANARDDPKIDEFYVSWFNGSLNFILLHETGHVFYRHPGNTEVPPAVSRAHEQEADQFALDLLAQVGNVPLSLPHLMLVMSWLQGDTVGPGQETLYQQSLAARTHPVSVARLEALARQLNVSAPAFNRAFKPGSQANASMLSVEVQTLANLMASPIMQIRAAAVGQSVTPKDLAPRRQGRFLAFPCGRATSKARTFEGSLHGQLTLLRSAAGSPAESTPPLKNSTEIDMILTRDGDNVTGSFSVGPGIGRLQGTVTGDILALRWQEAVFFGSIAGGTSGRGLLALDQGQYRGTFGSGNSTTGLALLLRDER
jgi:Peptidase family M48